jgi:hypothetical protein
MPPQLRSLAPHSGHSSQPFSTANYGNAYRVSNGARRRVVENQLFDHGIINTNQAHALSLS